MSFTYHKNFTEDLRDAVCEGRICPQCLNTNVKAVGSSPDGINLNIFYDCQECGAEWEGY